MALIARLWSRQGGRFITAMDITTVPSNPSSIRLLWNRGNREPLNEGVIDALGETFSTPVLGNVDTRIGPSTTLDEVDQWLVFAGGGYGCENSENEGQNLFAFRAEDGFIYYTAWAGKRHYGRASVQRASRKTDAIQPS